MAMRKNDIEQETAKRAKQEPDDLYDDEDTGSDEALEEIDVKPGKDKDLLARKRLEDYLEEKRLQKELGDDLLDFE
ncbi:MAG: hypothetical protein OEY52_15070 [Gammaproteobacteria bacterium]|nr:hypothetical protein [Gammaproteobacteria bacterium]